MWLQEEHGDVMSERFGGNKGTGLMWTDGMHALWDGGKDAVQTGAMHLTRDSKMHHAVFALFITNMRH